MKRLSNQKANPKGWLFVTGTFDAGLGEESPIY